MTSDNIFKINQLLHNTDRGVLLTSAWLKHQGISDKLAWWHVHSGWLSRIAVGAYALAADRIGWVGAVVALQQQLGLPLYPGGKTALQLLGRGHYVSMKHDNLQLFAPPRTRVPKWLYADYWEESFIVYRPSLFSVMDDKGFTALDIDGLTIQVSAPEKAVIELCYLVPNVVTFSEAALIVEGLVRIRPKVMQVLLERCTSYKAKRLLLYLAEYFQHSWFYEIDLPRIDLGDSKRSIAGGGCYSEKYKIAVPVLEERK